MNEDLQIKACGSLARDVPRRNLRSFSLVSGEKAYSRSDDYIAEDSSANISICVTDERCGAVSHSHSPCYLYGISR